MENNSGDKDKARSPQEETAKAAILAECGKLAKAGVTFVAVHFDGYGDDGPPKSEVFRQRMVCVRRARTGRL